MAISYRGVSNAAGQASGSAAASTVSITPTLPSGAASGDRIFVYQVGTTTSGTTPTGWTVIGTKDTTLGSGTAASGSGLRRATWYYRDYDGVWSMPAFTLTSVANNSHWVAAVAATPTSGFTFNAPTISTVGGAFNTATTSYTDTSAASFTTHSGGFLLVGTGLNDNVTASTTAVTQTGATFGTVTERADGGTSTGFIVSGKVYTAPVTTGASATITHTLTLNASSQGETLFVEQTEVQNATGTMGATLAKATFSGSGSIPGPAISTFTDDFESFTAGQDISDHAQWYNSSTVGASATVESASTVNTAFGSSVFSGGKALLLSADGAGVTAEAGSNDYYDFSGGRVWFEVGITTALFTTFDFFFTGQVAGVGINAYGGGGISMYVAHNGTNVRLVCGGDLATDIAYDPVAHRWMQFRETGGTIYFETSPNGSTWTVQDSISTGAFTGGVGLMYPSVTLIDFDGVGATKYVFVDNVNVASSTGMTGTVAAVLQKALFAGSGAQTQTGSVASTLQKPVFSGAGEQPYSGTVAATLQRLLFAGTAAQTQTGTIAAILQAATLAASGSQTQTGTVAALLRYATFTSSGYLQPDGAIVASLQKATFAGSASHAQTGAISAVMRAATMTSSGWMQPDGSISASLQKMLFAAAGTHAQSGSIASALRPATIAASASSEPEGNISAALQKAVASISGVQAQSGVITAQAARALMAASGAMNPEGLLSAALRPALMSASGAQAQSGTIAAAVQKLVFAALSEQILTGSLSSTLQPAEAELLAQMFPRGSISAQLRYALMSTGVGFHGQAGSLAGHIARLLFSGEGSATYTEPTPAERVLEFLAASRLHEFLAAIRGVEVLASTRLTEVQELPRLSDIHTQPREVTGG